AAAKKAALGHAASDEKDGERCLSCNTVCECCVDVCPNRANVAIVMENGSVQIIHVDRMCNECGNCKSFCPYASAPYKDKFTLFHTKEDFENSTNNGFLSLGDGKVLVRLGAVVKEHSLKTSDGLDEGIKALILRVWEKYSYL
ncbi:MAG: putative selenate reductase subunit YgfK, partial [Acetivibrio ethanolgignens]